MALTRVELPSGGRRRNRTSLATAEALDSDLFHTDLSGIPGRRVNARTREAGNQQRAARATGTAQSVEYFGWTFSPRIFAIALFAAIAASPKPTVMSVIFPS